MNRLHQILAGILAVQIVLAVIVFWPRAFASEAGGGPLLTDFSANEAVELKITDGDGNQITLAKAGDQWVLPEADDYPVDGSKVTPLLEKIENMQANRLVTQTDSSHKRLKVADDDFNRLVEIKLQNGKVQKIYLGSSAGAGATHVRKSDQSEVYLTGELNAFDVNARAAGWIDTLYYSVPVSTTVALSLENANGTLEFERDGDNWTMKGLAEGETFQQNNFTTLLNRVTSLRMTSPIGKEERPSFGLDSPLAIVTLKTSEDGQEKTMTLQVGAKDEESNSYVVKWSESPYFVRVAEFTGKSLIEEKREDLIKIPEEQNSGSTPESSGQSG